jgi:type IX secretion system PorP/SprF family membrane protein
MFINKSPKFNFLTITQKGFILLCLFLFLSINALTQTTPLYQKHFGFEQFINPAITGRDISPVVNISHKRYWLGVDNAPNTTCIAGSMRLGSFNFYNPKKLLNRTGFVSRSRMGFGGLLMQDNDGPLQSYYISATYSYFIPLFKKNSELSFGISADLMAFNIRKSILDPLQTGDPTLQNIKSGKLIPESGFGIYYHDLQFYAGCSVNDLLLTNRPLQEGDVDPNQRDYFFQTGYKFFLKRYELEPSIYIAKVDNNKLYYYNQLKFYYLNYNWFVVGYKSTKSLLVSLGMSLNRIHFAYVFEQNISEMGNYFHGAHEIMLGVNIGIYEPEGMRKRAKIK